MSDSTAQRLNLSQNLGEIFPIEELLPSLLEVSLTGVVFFKPIFKAGTFEIIDFAFLMLNNAAQDLLRLPEKPGQTLLQVHPHAKQTGIFAFYQNTFLSGKPKNFEVNYQYDGFNAFFKLKAQRAGNGLIVSISEIADQDRTAVEKSLRESQTREQMARAEAELQLAQLQNVLMQAPAMICIFEGPNHVFKFVNQAYQQLVGKRPLVGKPIAEAMPELTGQPIFGLLDNVYQTGETFRANEMLVQLDHENKGGDLGQNYYTFIYQPTRNLEGKIDGILVFAYEVTPLVRARRQIEYSHQQVQELNEELQVLNEELQATNEELVATNEEFYNNYAELLDTQEELKQLNQELELRVNQRTQALQIAQAETEEQRQRLERLFMQAPAAICILDGPEFTFQLVNPTYQQVFPGRELLGKKLVEALPEVEGTLVTQYLNHVFQTGETIVAKELPLMVSRHEGESMEEVYFSFTYQARRNGQGEIDGILVFAYEVTDQVKARRSIEENAKQLRLITDALPVLISYLDREEKYRFVNQAYESWFHTKPEDLLGRSAREVVGEKAYQGIKQYIDRALAGERLDFEARMPYRENFTKYIRTSYVPEIRDGEVAGFYTMVSDVTDQVEAQKVIKESEQQAKALAEDLARTNEELRQANQQLTRTNVDLDNFIYTASHDLKAPILNIEGLMEALLDQLPTASLQEGNVQRTMDLILDSVHRFKRTIDHLTEITKLQKENSGEILPVNVAALLAEVQLDLAPVIQESTAQIEIDISLCPTIRFSEKNLRSILYNLLSNAIKYHAPNRPPKVRVFCSITQDYQVLSVEDNGLGIDLNQEHKLFAMFKRLHNHVEGTGIGLYMVKKIIENAGGKIEVESKVDEGSTFRVFFPINL
ncbi:MAG: PAS domain-containing protein [Bacteroidota bacterium]|nr:PAS domain-containing protein [Bacteroidota bacterium]